VVNLDLPNQAEDYVHRIGRTGRAGHNGHAVSLVAAEEHELLRAIERLIGNPLPRQEIGGFEPTVLSAPPLDLSGGRGRGGRPAGRGGDRSGGGARRGAAPASRAASGRPSARSSSARPRSGR
jgi:ATP-dependent RNA helicase RhlE